MERPACVTQGCVKPAEAQHKGGFYKTCSWCRKSRSTRDKQNLYKSKAFQPPGKGHPHPAHHP